MTRALQDLTFSEYLLVTVSIHNLFSDTNTSKRHITLQWVWCCMIHYITELSLRTIGAVVHGGSTIFCSGSPTGVRDVQRHLVFPVDFYILNGQIGHKKGISAKHWYVASFEIVQIH